MTRAKFYWARIGDGNYEPVAVRGKKGERLAYTIGCPDPFPVDTPDTAVLLAEDGYDDLTAPLTPAQEENARRRERHARTQFAHHGYAGFGRTGGDACKHVFLGEAQEQARALLAKIGGDA